MDKIKVGGIKLSRELVQVNVRWQAETGALTSLLRHTTEQKINLTYLSVSTTLRPAMASFCVADSDFERVKMLIDAEPDLGKDIEIKAPVGALTVFPHRSSFRLLGLMLAALSKAGCPIYGVASSISALTLNTNYWLIGRALQTLESILDLPPNHTPYRQEFLVKQI